MSTIKSFLRYYRLQFLTLILMFSIGLPYSLNLVSAPKAPTEGHPSYASYQRMMSNIECWTQAPHYAGSAELDRVRREILDEIAGMGFEAQVESYNSGRPSPHNPNKYELDEEGNLWVTNILVKIEGSRSDQAFLFVSHYDGSDDPSVGDDMIAVCAMLEALRSLAGKAPQNSLYFLFTDGEEVNRFLSGASHVLKSHPELLEEVELVLNFEGMVGLGNIAIVGTSANNLALLSLYQRVDFYQYGSSFYLDYFRLADKSGDLYHFLDAGMQGMNILYLGDAKHYHTPGDSFEHLDRDGAYLFYDTVLKLTNFLAIEEIGSLDASEDSVFFALIRGEIVLVPLNTARLILAVVVLLAIAWILALRKRDDLSPVMRQSLWTIKFTLISTILLSFFVSYGLQHFIIPLLALLIHSLLHFYGGSRKNHGAIFLWSVCAGGMIMILNVPILYHLAPIELAVFGIPPVSLVLLCFLVPIMLSLAEISSDEAVPLATSFKQNKSQTDL